MNNFSAAAIRHSYHSANWALDVNLNSVKKYIDQFAKVFEIVELSTERPKRPFRSFKVTIDSNYDPAFHDPSKWPAGVITSRWWQTKKKLSNEINQISEEIQGQIITPELEVNFNSNTNKHTINCSAENLVPKSNATPAATTSLKKNANPSKSVDFGITILDDSNQNHNEALSNETTENNNNVQNESMNEEDQE